MFKENIIRFIKAHGIAVLAMGAAVVFARKRSH